MRSTALLVIVWVVAAVVSAGEAAPTIDEVAGDRLQLLHSDNDWRIFSITVASGDTLADHASGPRAILTLTDLEIKTLVGEAEPTTAQPWHARWLTNTFSRGFENIGNDPLQYLVIEARDRGVEVEDVTHGCSAGMPLLVNSRLSICRIEERSSGTTIELDHPSWLYSAEPIMTGGDGHHLVLTAGVHTLQAANSPVVIVSFHPR